MRLWKADYESIEPLRWHWRQQKAFAITTYYDYVCVMKKWSRKYNECKNCGTIKIKHKGNGFCQNCWERLVRNRTPKRKKWQKKYRELNVDKIRKNNNKYDHIKREKIIDLLGGKCRRCGFDDMRALQIDHVNGGGYKEMKNIHSRERLRLVIESVKKGENKYQLLCANCNWIKRYEDKEKKELGGRHKKYI